MKAIKVAVGVLCLVWLPYVGAITFLRHVTHSWQHPLSWLASDLAATIVAVLALLFTQFRAHGSWVSAMQNLGIAPIRWKDLIAGGLAALPALVGLTVAFIVTEGDRALHQKAITTAIRIVFAQALLEELLFRGFLFKRLCRQLSYRWAAIVAGATFGLCHLGNFLLHGFSPDKGMEIGIQVVITSFLALAPIYLVWRSGGLLWGACVWHLLVDLPILFPDLAPNPQAAIPMILGTLLTIPMAYAVARWMYAKEAAMATINEEEIVSLS